MCMIFEEIVDDLSKIVDREVELHGHIVVDVYDNSYIATNYEAFLRGERLPVKDDKQIAFQLNEVLPPYCGGRCNYSENVFIVGTVERDSSGYYLTDLKSCKVRRKDIEIAIKFRAKDA